jgi:hypothetical protein
MKKLVVLSEAECQLIFDLSIGKIGFEPNTKGLGPYGSPPLPTDFSYGMIDFKLFTQRLPHGKPLFFAP